MAWCKILSTSGAPQHVDRHCSAPRPDIQEYHGRTVAARYYYACETDYRLHAGRVGTCLCHLIQPRSVYSAWRVAPA